MRVGKLEKDELYQMQKLRDYCFAGQGYAKEETEFFFPLDYYLGVFDEEECEIDDNDEKKKRRILASCMIQIPFLVKLCQSTFQSLGIRGVTSKPEYRNQGLIRKLFEYCFEKMKEKNIPLSNLYPFKESYYEKYGYALCEEVIITKFNPSSLTKLRSLPRSKRKLRIREVYGDKIHSDIKSVYEAVSLQKYDHCMLERSEWFWNELTMRNQVFQFVCYDESEGEESSSSRRKKPIPVGYIIWHLETDLSHWYTRLCGIKPDEIHPRTRAFVIREMNWITTEAKNELIRFIWKHRDQLTTCAMMLPIGEDITQYFGDPAHQLQRMIYPKTQMRIVLLKEVLEGIQVSPFYALDGIIIRVVDKFCPWNDGFWRLEKKVGEKTLKAEKVGDNISEEEEDDIEFLCLEIKQVTMMVAGVLTIDDILATYGTDSSELMKNVKEVQRFVEGLRCFERRRFNYFNDLY